MITTSGLNHLALPVRDPRRAAQFYADLFNMEITSATDDMTFVKTIGRRDMLAFSRSEDVVPSTRNSLHFGFMVEPEQFDAALEVIEARGVQVVGGPSERPIGRYVFIEDLEGYTVEIFECLEEPFA